MTIYVYPIGWTPPEEPEPVALTEQERADLKAGIKAWIDARSEPILLKKLLDKCQRNVVDYIGKHVDEGVLLDICLEIREENGYPGQVVEPQE